MTFTEKYINPFTDFGFKKLPETAEIAKFSSEKKEQYEDSLKIYRDLKNVIDTAFGEGKIEGKMERYRKSLETRQINRRRNRRGVRYNGQICSKIKEEI